MLKLTPKTADHAAASSPLISSAAVVIETEEAVTVEDARIALFLDAIIARLTSLPAEFHDEVRRELRFHLDALIAAHEELGATREESIGAAIRQFGDSRQIARRYRQAWRRTGSITGHRAAMWDALATFGVAMTLLLGVYAVTFNCLFTVARTNAVEIRVLLTWGMLGTLGLILPILAGIWIGRRSPRHATSSALVALLPLSVLALPLLHCDGVVFGCYSRLAWTVASLCSIAGLASLVWLPVGTVAALITSVIIRRRQSGT